VESKVNIVGPVKVFVCAITYICHKKPVGGFLYILSFSLFSRNCSLVEDRKGIDYPRFPDPPVLKTGGLLVGN
jgi:hypothetical protein